MRRKLKLACGGDGAAAFWPAVKSNKLKFHFPKPGPIEGESA